MCYLSLTISTVAKSAIFSVLLIMRIILSSLSLISLATPQFVLFRVYVINSVTMANNKNYELFSSSKAHSIRCSRGCWNGYDNNELFHKIIHQIWRQTKLETKKNSTKFRDQSGSTNTINEFNTHNTSQKWWQASVNP